MSNPAYFPLTFYCTENCNFGEFILCDLIYAENCFVHNNPVTPKISFLILFTVFDINIMMLV